MKDLFFTNNRPYHRFRTERFFFHYLRVRSNRCRAAFGSGTRQSYFGQMLLMKRFFIWYYQIRSLPFFNKIFMKKFLKAKGGSFRYFGLFLQLIESNILTALVRVGLSTNYNESQSLVANGMILVNGSETATPFCGLHIGDLVELHPYMLYYRYYRFAFLFTKELISYQRRYFFLHRWAWAPVSWMLTCPLAGPTFLVRLVSPASSINLRSQNRVLSDSFRGLLISHVEKKLSERTKIKSHDAK